MLLLCEHKGIIKNRIPQEGTLLFHSYQKVGIVKESAFTKSGINLD